MNAAIKDGRKALSDDFTKFVQLRSDIEEGFRGISGVLEDADEVIASTLSKKMYDSWRENLRIIDGRRSASYGEQLEALDECVRLLEFAEFILKGE